MSIKRKLTLMMMGISLTAVTLAVAAIAAYLIYDMRESRVQALEATAALTADRNRAAVTFMATDQIETNLEIFRQTPAIMVSCLYNKQGEIIGSYHSGKMLCPVTTDKIPATMDGMLTASRNIQMSSGDITGSVYIVSDTREINEFVTKVLLIGVTTILIVLGVMTLVTMYLQRAISGPISELTRAAETITAGGNYTIEARDDYPDETGVLARAFNAMIREVRKRDDELTRANETLEQKVVDRTRELEESMRRAEAASAAKSEFLRNMSHEFRTPLHGIISFSVYGNKEYADAPREQLKQYFEYVQKSAERLSRLVNQVLDLARFEQKREKPDYKAGDLRELITRATEPMRGLLQDKHLVLRLDQPAEPIDVTCDHDKITQVITNLLGNAIKFTPEYRHIHIVSRIVAGDNNQLMVSVIDEGVGIPESEKEAIFESFRQSSRTNTGAGGTGLGLAICQNIIAAHGGKIWAENNTGGQGARVTFTIPATPAASATTGKPTEGKHEHAA